ncbi:beta-propeller domain-containing protein [Staphylothermus hellenicus]|uniref:Beta propeller domain protein n=1 Tax=Staphylothermus hellenicus (strain DSM 12710 / JCM 10830 / BK20S6-10-b1 / P8) TaxID=591019 RepID=D7D806_STAHD|nr:beta-propeller domain-containing protein [Staphylothermus hellenicus]ADI31902.1 Beta propeller domain protein [Staphylothermus hellenicus DSM 12710]
MDGSKIIILGAIALIIGILLPITMHTIFFSGTRNTGNPIRASIEANLPKIKEMESFSSYSELLNYLNKTLAPTQSNPEIMGILNIEKSVMHTPVGAVPLFETQQRTTIRYSSTNVQVKGIDEPDIVKTNGKIIAVAKGDTVYIIDAVRDVYVGKIVLNSTINSIYISGDHLIVLTIMNRKFNLIQKIINENTAFTMTFPLPGTISEIHVYSISDPSKPVKLYNISVTGTIISSRLKDNILYTIMQQPVYDTSITIPSIGEQLLPPENIYLVDKQPVHYTNIIALNITSGKYSAYSFLTGPTSWVYMSHKYLVLASSNPYWIVYREQAMRTITKYMPEEIKKQLEPLIENNNYYKALEIINDYLNKLDQDNITEIVNNINSGLNTSNFTDYTKLYILDINQLSLEYKGEIEVPGIILDQFSIEEYRNNYLVVATTVSNYKLEAEFHTFSNRDNAVIISVNDSNGTKKWMMNINKTLVERGWKGFFSVFPSLILKYNELNIIDLSDLEIISKLSNLAVNEDIKASRLVGDLFILVTYRQVDPLFAINISDPENPVVLGYLEIPGYNEYLHPVSKNLLLGIGVEGGKLMVSLYNISDPENIVQVAKATLSPLLSPVLQDYHAFTIDPEKKLIFIPVATALFKLENELATCGDGVAVIEYSNTSLIVLKIIDHPYIVRTLYIGDKLYIISPYMVRVFNEATLELIKTIWLS